MLSVDEFPAAVPAGLNCTYPGAAAVDAVRLPTTADTCAAGTPPRPSTSRGTVADAGGSEPLERVSRMRAGFSGRNRPSALEGSDVVVNQPRRSTITCVDAEL